MSIDRGIDKEYVVHICNGILLSCKKGWNNAICSNIKGPRDYHTKGSKLENGKYHMILSIIYVESKNKWTYKTETYSDRENKFMVIKGDGWGGINWEYGINRCTPPNIK